MARGAYPGSFNPPTNAHLAVAEAALVRYGLEGVDLVVSRVALGKEEVERPRFDDRVAVLKDVVASRPWLGLRVTQAQLIADLAEGYEVIVMGADKWAQILDPAWYRGSEAARDEAIARLPQIAVVARGSHRVPADGIASIQILDVAEEHGIVSSSGARAGRTEWMTTEAAEFDARTGAWSDPKRYNLWLAQVR